VSDPADILRDVCSCIEAADLDRAANTIRKEYRFQPFGDAGRRYTPFQCLQVFLRDGFRDRYTGQRLVNPAVLRLISALLPRDFPAHPNWKQSESHIGFWQLSPTIDHVVPVARGGEDSDCNWVTTSMFRNQAKGNALLDELGWQLHPPGDLAAWDGLSGWVVDYVDADPVLNTLPSDSARHRNYIERWARASKRALAAGEPRG